MSKSLLVTGATGKQGGSLIKALVNAKADFQILAVTRNAASPSAQKLLNLSPNIKLVSGDFDNIDAMFSDAKAASGVPIWGVYSVQVAINNSKEEAYGNALVDAAIANNVKHFVYSSVDRGGDLSDQNPTDVPHFITKHNIEQHLISSTKGSAMTYTILRPVAFFENLVPGMLGKVFSTAWTVTLRPEQKLQLIATADIGHFAAQAFTHPEQHRNAAISLAGDELTFSQFKSIFEDKTGQPLPMTYGFIASIMLWLVKDLGYMFRWFRDVGYGADIAALRRSHPGLKDFKTWLKEDSQF